MQEKPPPELWDPGTVQTEYAEQEAYEVDEPFEVDDADVDDERPSSRSRCGSASPR